MRHGVVVACGVCRGLGKGARGISRVEMLQGEECVAHSPALLAALRSRTAQENSRSGARRKRTAPRGVSALWRYGVGCWETGQTGPRSGR
eukprot:973058-Pyramimonas_sp.AAC.1